jgi:hypothetical protein
VGTQGCTFTVRPGLHQDTVAETVGVRWQMFMWKRDRREGLKEQPSRAMSSRTAPTAFTAASRRKLKRLSGRRSENIVPGGSCQAFERQEEPRPLASSVTTPGVAEEALVKLDSGSSVGEILAVFRPAAQRHACSGFGVDAMMA